jgi:hypothetical protein
MMSTKHNTNCNTLTFKRLGWYLHFSAWSTKNVSFEQKKIKLKKKKQYFVEKKTEIMQHVLKMQSISLLPKHINEFLGVFFDVHLHM